MENFVNWKGYKIGDLGSVISPRGRRLHCRPWRASGRRYVQINGPGGPKKHLVSRLVFLCHGGEIPPGFQINHKNGNKADDRIKNLEAVSPRENVLHGYKTGLYKAGQTLPRGVSRSGRKYAARISKNGRPCHLGVFETPEEAAEAYRAAAVAAEGEGIKRYI